MDDSQLLAPDGSVKGSFLDPAIIVDNVWVGPRRKQDPANPNLALLGTQMEWGLLVCL